MASQRSSASVSFPSLQPAIAHLLTSLVKGCHVKGLLPRLSLQLKLRHLLWQLRRLQQVLHASIAMDDSYRLAGAGLDRGVICC